MAIEVIVDLHKDPAPRNEWCLNIYCEGKRILHEHHGTGEKPEIEAHVFSYNVTPKDQR